MAEKTLRPKDAATLLLYRGAGDDVRVLLGQRHHGHIFMPNAYVFPGGRVNPADSRVPPVSPLRADVAARLERAATPARARAIAVAAIRETFEETGLLIAGGDGDQWHPKIGPHLGAVDYFFRAITPPNRVRRFDARFFFAEAVAAHGELGGDGELQNLAWFSLEEIRDLEMAGITRIALAEFRRVLADPASRDPDRPVPVSRFIRGRYHISME
ncbi:MAG: NUDIX hydrolase [Alphaproteobacteria bacterium]|nr:NUDIX hydrolase [Alphaproteobacteria bacterium]